MQKWVSSSESSVLPLCFPGRCCPVAGCWWFSHDGDRTTDGRSVKVFENGYFGHNFFPKLFFLQVSIWKFVFPSRFSYSKFQRSGIKKLEKLEHLVKAATWLHECKPTSPLFVRGSQFSGLFWASIANHNCVIAKVPTAHRLVFACLSVGLWSLHVYSKEYDLAVATYKEAVETLRPTPQDAMDGII